MCYPNAASVLMHSDNGCIDHLHRRIIHCGQCIHDLVPDTSPSPANEAGSVAFILQTTSLDWKVVSVEPLAKDEARRIAANIAKFMISAASGEPRKFGHVS
jgi:hypothetical protein